MRKKTTRKRILSAITASAIVSTQMLAAMPFGAMATAIPDDNSEKKEMVYGDVNQNGYIDPNDYIRFEIYFKQRDEKVFENPVAADVDLDGKITVRDLQIIREYYHNLSDDDPALTKPYDREEFAWIHYPNPANYEIINEHMTWEEAEQYCESKGGHLAVIDGPNEQLVINSLISELEEPLDYYWVGMYLNRSGYIDFITAERSFYENWYYYMRTPDERETPIYIYGKGKDEDKYDIGSWEVYGGFTNGNNESIENFGFILEKDGKPAAKYKPWTDESSLPESGLYKLECDVNVSAVTINDDLDIDLNGHTINTEGITIADDGNFILRDPEHGNSGTVNCTSTGNLISVYGNFLLLNGTLNGNKENNVSENDSSVVKMYNEGYFEMDDGVINSYHNNTLSISKCSYIYLYGGELKNAAEKINDNRSEGSTVWIEDNFRGFIYICGSALYSNAGPCVCGTLKKYDEYEEPEVYIAGGTTINSCTDYGVYCDGYVKLLLGGKIDVKGKKAGIFLPKGQKIHIEHRLENEIYSASVTVEAEESGCITEGLADPFDTDHIPPDFLKPVNGELSGTEKGEVYYTLSSDKHSTYQIFNTPLSWDDAKEFCENNDGHLVTITSAKEQAAIEKLLKSEKNAESRYWIGTGRLHYGYIKMLNSEQYTFSNWDKEYPEFDNGYDVKNAAVIFGTSDKDTKLGKWSLLDLTDEDVSYKYGFICEWDESDHKKIDEPVTGTTTAATTTNIVTTSTTTIPADAGAAAGNKYDTGKLDPTEADFKPVLSLSKISIPYDKAAGSVQNIDLKLDNAEGKYLGYQFCIRWDDRLKIDKTVETGDAVKDVSLAYNIIDDDLLVLNTAYDSKQESKDGTICTFELTVPSDCKPGDRYPIEITYMQPEFSDTFVTEYFPVESDRLPEAWLFTHGIVQGYIEITDDEENITQSELSGDANCDNNVDLADSVLIMQTISNPDKYGESGIDKNHITAQGKKNADVSGNGDGLTNSDALAVQRYKLSLVKELPVKK